VFAYGITGTGKTHTIFGDLQKYIDFNTYDENSKFYYEMGICVYAIDYLFSKIFSSHDKIFNIKISYLEIYNEQVIDLLDDNNSNLMIVEDNQRGIIVPDLTEYHVKSSKELISMIIKGNAKRTMAPTGENQFSSRSHAILQIVIEQKTKLRDLKEALITSKFLLVDLAGSERSGLEKGIRTHEGKNINKSLLSLGNCINLLSDKSKKGSFVPYRDSKLTRLLKDSLAGNIMSVMIACVSPSPTCYDETVNTLKYAMKARKIEKHIHKNSREVDVHISQYKDIIDSLKNEIEQLKIVIKNQQNINLITSKKNSFIDLVENKELKSNSDNEIENNTNDRSGSKDKSEKNLFENKLSLNNYFVKNVSNDIDLNLQNYDVKNDKTIRNSNLKNGINIGNSMELGNSKKNSFNNNQKLSFDFRKENVLEGSNLIMFSNNASILTNQNGNNYGKNNYTNQNINKSNGRANSCVSGHINNTYLGKDNSITSHISGNFNAGVLYANSKTSGNNTNNNSKNKNSLIANYTQTNKKKIRRYSEMSRNMNIGTGYQANEKDKNNNSFSSPKNCNNFTKVHKETYNNHIENYVNYRKFMVKNGEDECDIDEFARNVDL